MLELIGKIDENDYWFIRRRYGEPRFSIVNDFVSSLFVLNNNNICRVFHTKPIYYINKHKQFRPLYEIATYYGNQSGMILKNGWEDKIDFGYLVWYIKRLKIIQSKYGVSVNYPQTYHGIILDDINIPLFLCGSGDPIYPDPNPESTTVDGAVARINDSGETWSTMRGGAGTNAGPSETDNWLSEIRTTAGSTWNAFDRSILLFDTSGIGTGTISSATMSFWVIAKYDNYDQSVCLVDSNPASNTNLVTSDYGNVGTTQQASDIDITSITTSAYNDFTLNATGLASINKTGVTKFGSRTSGDRSDTEPSKLSNKIGGVHARFADYTGTSYDPKLIVIYAAATSIKSWNGLAKASIKSINGLAIGSVKNINGLS